MDVDGMLSRRQIVQVELDHHAIALVHKRCSYALALGVFQFDLNFGSTGQREREDTQNQNGEREYWVFHNGHYSANADDHLRTRGLRFLPPTPLTEL